MKTVVIGMGNMGGHYAALILDGKIPGLALAAATRINAAGAEKLGARLPLAQPVYQTADELFAAYDAGAFQADAAVIATPHLSHAALAAAAFARGLSVLCDKPAGVCTRQAREMTQAYQKAAAARPLAFGFVFQQRTLPVYRAVRQLVQSGRYGGVRRVNWAVTDWYRPNAYYTAAAWRGTWARDGGGTLLNQCPHNLDLLQWICGMPVRVRAFCRFGQYHPIEVEDDVTAYLEWENGATGVFIASTGEAAGVNRLEISLDDALLVCENGTLRVKALDKPERVYRAAEGDVFAKPHCEWHDVPCEQPAVPPYEAVLSNFADACAGRAALIAPGEEGIRSLYLSNAMYLSTWQDRTVELPAPGSEAERAFEQSFEAELNKRRKQ